MATVFNVFETINWNQCPMKIWIIHMRYLRFSVTIFFSYSVEGSFDVDQVQYWFLKLFLSFLYWQICFDLEKRTVVMMTCDTAVEFNYILCLRTIYFVLAVYIIYSVVLNSFNEEFYTNWPYSLLNCSFSTQPFHFAI